MKTFSVDTQYKPVTSEDGTHFEPTFVKYPGVIEGVILGDVFNSAERMINVYAISPVPDNALETDVREYTHQALWEFVADNESFKQMTRARTARNVYGPYESRTQDLTQRLLVFLVRWNDGYY